VLRQREGDRTPRVTNMELFFDLVYVFAITQLSDRLFESLTARGLVQSLVLFLAVWWAWNYTAWATNWIDPERTTVALLMLVLMAISLVMSAAIPQAFGARGLTFAATYVGLQLLRSGFMVWALQDERMGRNYAQLLAWSAIAGVFWVAGALVSDQDARLAVWAVALVLDLGAPMHGFRLPRVGSTPIGDWTLAGAHLAERMQLVLMIALGESILRVGATLSSLEHPGLAVDLAFVTGFVGTAALWAMYFLGHAELGVAAISRSFDESARLGRAAYAYGHAVMVLGVLVIAVAIRLTIGHPGGTVSTLVGVTILGGPALFLAGLALFKYSVLGHRPDPPLIGIGVLALLALVALFASRLALALCATAVVLVLAIGAVRSGEDETV